MDSNDDDYNSTPCSITQPSVTCTYDSDDYDASFNLIDQMISDDKLSTNSINSETCTENQSTAEYLTSAANAITRNCLERNTKLFPSTSCESTPLTPESFRSSRLGAMKNRLRSLEVQYTEQKDAPFTKSITPSFHVNASVYQQ